MKLFKYVFLTMILVGYNFINAFAQCALCKASVESNLKEESHQHIGAGINSGVIYLMVVPYIIFPIVAYLWYKHSKKNKLIEF